ncbi:MAG: exodeoxyribonuclease VII large subunit [Patescibacteria group bacterium]
MDAKKLRQLREWRDRQARQEGVEIFRVLGNQTLEEIVVNDVKTEKGLLEVKGIKEKKLAKYGREILEIMSRLETAPLRLSKDDLPLTGSAADQIIAAARTGEKIFSVSVFLDLVNTGLRTFEVKIKGEVSSVDERNGNYYFGLKDKEDGSTISCLIWKSNYRLTGVELKEGMEIVVHGWPNVYKPSGRLSFHVDTIEMVGEGALKQQYEELKKKLEAEGLFAPERKKPIPLFPTKIGLITSRQGEAIFDFRTNLGQFGFQIKFLDSRVEGVQAVPSLIKAVRYFKDKDIDVLVLVRGGGSLESLLSFNNEALVREIVNFPKPVVAGIGHDQDVSLLDLVADRSCSTPTGVAKLLSYSWEQALAKINLYAKDIFGRYRKELFDQKYSLQTFSLRLKKNFSLIFENFRALDYRLKQYFSSIGAQIKSYSTSLSNLAESITLHFEKNLRMVLDYLKLADASITTNNPERQLRLGYSLVSAGGKILKSVAGIGKGEEIEVRLQDGKIYSEVRSIEKKHLSRYLPAGRQGNRG